MLCGSDAEDASTKLVEEKGTLCMRRVVSSANSTSDVDDDDISVIIRSTIDSGDAELFRLQIAALVDGQELPEELPRTYLRRSRGYMTPVKKRNTSTSHTNGTVAMFHSPQIRHETPVWANEKDAGGRCMRCRQHFSTFRWKHHCRLCGMLVCGRCAPRSYMYKIPQYGHDERVRVCAHCATHRIKRVFKDGSIVLDDTSRSYKSEGEVLTFTKSPLRLTTASPLKTDDATTAVV